MLPSLALKIHQQPLSPDKVDFLSRFYSLSLQSAMKPSQRDPLSQSEAEDELTDWLEEHGVNDSWKLAPMLVAAGLKPDDLEQLKTQVDPDCTESVLTWLEATLTGICTLDQIKLSSTRISDLIKAMKDYSYMDIMKHKLKYGVEVIREYGDLPHICAYGRELNQVWTNLIDNATDAMNGKGHLWIRTAQEGARVLVEITDDGSGIPSEIQPRIFDQFFTTKSVGKGTGLGLDIVHRIVEGQHKGSVRFESKPGETRFQVRIPINVATC